MILKIGEIKYANLYPVYETLRRHFDCSRYEFVQGVPSDLNRMLRAGAVDISASSSVEYLLHRDVYDYMPGHSISARGAVHSIILFSKHPLGALDHKKIAVTSDSDTSFLLLRVLLEHFERKTPEYIRTTAPLADVMATCDACLLIGDAALRESAADNGLRMYDLGALWTDRTALPFVFALWTVRKDLPPEKNRLVTAFADNIRRAGYMMKFDFRSLARTAPQTSWMGSERLIEYWRQLSYDLTPEHLNGMELFNTLIDTLTSTK
jgi:chorismate dehydratase